MLDHLFNGDATKAALATWLLAVLLDTVLGVIIAFRGKVFSFDKLPSVLATQLFVKEVGGLAVLGASAYAAGGWKPTYLAVATGAGALTLAVLVDIKGKVTDLTGIVLPIAGTPAVDKPTPVVITGAILAPPTAAGSVPGA